MKSFEMVQTEPSRVNETPTDSALRGPWMALPSSPDETNSAGTVASSMRFRARVHLDSPSPTESALLICADSRYRLSVNGHLVAAGPAKPSGNTWFADQVDISDHLTTGLNIIGIDVVSYSTSALGNASVLRTGRPGLFVQGMVGNYDLSAPSAWKCHPVSGRRFHQGLHTVFLGIQETVDGTLSEHDWQNPSFDDSSWNTPDLQTPQPFAAVPRPALAARTIPALTLAPVPLANVTRSTGPALDWAALLTGDLFQVPPNSDVSADFDADSLMTAFLSLSVQGGAGAHLEITAAECYEEPPLQIPWQHRKGDRTDHRKADLYGDPDRYAVSGSGTAARPEIYSPFWFRTFRFLRLRIVTASVPLVVRTVDLTQTHYPLDITGTFASSSDLDARLWETSVRTLLNCMHETFEDCPYYEQLQYAMDTRSQALFTMHLSTDDRLIRRAIEDFAASGNSIGLTESRFPSVEPQYIPGFSLYWIRMVAEHVSYVGERAFTERFIGRIDAVLSYFKDRLSPDGFVISPHDDGIVWNFVDWTAQWRTSRGVPDLGPRRANTIATFMYIAALRSASEIARFCNRPSLSDEYADLADLLARQMAESPAWDGKTGYFRDSDCGTPQSVHAQVWAVLSGVVRGGTATDLLMRATAEKELASCSYAATLDLFDALRQAGADQRVDWSPWEDMLAANLTTWAEDTVSQRSDCHAWGSVPLQHFPRYILGVSPTAPGFTTASINPAPSSLDWAEGSVPTPHGPVTIHWKRAAAGSRSVTVSAPAGMLLQLPDTASQVTEQLDGGRRTLEFTF